MARNTTLAEALVLRPGLCSGNALKTHSNVDTKNTSGCPQAMPGPWQGLRSRASQGPDQPVESIDLLTTCYDLVLIPILLVVRATATIALVSIVPICLCCPYEWRVLSILLRVGSFGWIPTEYANGLHAQCRAAVWISRTGNQP